MHPDSIGIAQTRRAAWAHVRPRPDRRGGGTARHGATAYDARMPQGDMGLFAASLRDLVRHGASAPNTQREVRHLTAQRPTALGSQSDTSFAASLRELVRLGDSVSSIPRTARRQRINDVVRSRVGRRAAQEQASRA